MDKNKKKVLIKMNLEPTEKILQSLKGKELNRFNLLYQKIKGKKEYEYMTINNFSKIDVIEKFENIMDFDYDDWKFQKEHQTTVREEYDSLYLPGIWFRAIPINFLGKRELLYGQLESGRSYINRETYELIMKKINKKYPYIFSHEYGKFSFGSSYEIKAGGFEKERGLLVSELNKLVDEIEMKVLEELKLFDNFTFKKTSDDPIMEGLTLYIFGGLEASKATRLKHFFKDFTEKEQPIEILEKIIKRLSKKYFKKIKINSKKNDILSI